ncbi:MAG: GNAT family N-acetyltransferase [Propylenella sp.]
MTLTIAQEPADSADARALLKARDEENFRLYPPEARFAIPADAHVSEGVLFFIARENGVPIGCGALKRYERYAEMKSVFLLPPARGRRLGQEIIRALEQAARELGYDDIRLETGRLSPWAIKTYERAGYSRCSRFGDYPVDSPLSVYMMKRLGQSATSSARPASGANSGIPLD